MKKHQSQDEPINEQTELTEISVNVELSEIVRSNDDEETSCCGCEVVKAITGLIFCSAYFIGFGYIFYKI